MDARPECHIAAAEKGPSRKPDGRRGGKSACSHAVKTSATLFVASLSPAGLVSAFHKIFGDRNTLNIQSIGHLECAGTFCVLDPNNDVNPR